MPVISITWMGAANVLCHVQSQSSHRIVGTVKVNKLEIYWARWGKHLGILGSSITCWKGYIWIDHCNLWRSGQMPCFSYKHPENLVDGTSISHFLVLKTNPCSMDTASCAASSLPSMMMLLVITSVLTMCSRTWAIGYWNMCYIIVYARL